MKMKRMFALLLAAVMLFGCALAEPESVVTLYDENGHRIDEMAINPGESVDLDSIGDAACDTLG